MTVPKMWVFVLACPVLLLLSLGSRTPQATAKNDHGDEPRYKVLSQRWMTEAEKRNFNDVVGLRIAVRMRFENGGNRAIYYSASQYNVLPHGCQYTRNIGTAAWDSRAQWCREQGTREREASSDKFRWLLLPSGSAIEFDLYDYSDSNEEHAFSTFVKETLEDKPMEIVSTAYRPLSANSE